MYSENIRFNQGLQIKHLAFGNKRGKIRNVLIRQNVFSFPNEKRKGENIKPYITSSSDYSGAPSPQYPTGHGEAVAVPVGPGFPAPRPIEEQTEPVDFSTANEPVNFSGGPGIRPVPGFPPPGVHVTAYSRESTPDSGGSHYMDAYRDPTGELSLFIITRKIVHHRSRKKYFILNLYSIINLYSDNFCS